jgi:hypothetical protein
VPGAILVGGGLVAKALYERRKSRRAAKAATITPRSRAKRREDWQPEGFDKISPQGWNGSRPALPIARSGGARSTSAGQLQVAAGGEHFAADRSSAMR